MQIDSRSTGCVSADTGSAMKQTLDAWWAPDSKCFGRKDGCDAYLVVNDVAPGIAGVSYGRVPIIRRRELLVCQKLLKQSQHDGGHCDCAASFSFTSCTQAPRVAATDTALQPGRDAAPERSVTYIR